MINKSLFLRFVGLASLMTVLLVLLFALYLKDGRLQTNSDSLPVSFASNSPQPGALRQALRDLAERDSATPTPNLDRMIGAENSQKVAPPPQVAGVPAPKSQLDEETSPEVQRAIELIDGGKVNEAVALLEEVLRNDPENEQALVELAMAHLLDLKQPDKAIDYLQRVMDFNPRNQVVVSELVHLYEEQGRADEGLAFLQGVLAKNPAAQEVNYGVGQLLSMQGRPQDSIPYLEKAAKNPGSESSARVTGELASAYAKSGDRDKAVDTYTDAIRTMEREIQDKSSRGLPATIPEDQLYTMRQELIRVLIDLGRLDEAQQVLDETGSSAVGRGDESLARLQEEIARRRG